jgi:signal transduction histidine kinase
MVISVIVGALAAFIFARRLSERVAALAAGSKQIAAGNLETRIAQDGRDELANLATSFNQMASALDAARKKITQQTNEIMAWNQTLEKRVEEKTTELRQAQDLLLRSRSLSALGELGAGVAHEINNPLTGALGIVQLLLADLPAATRPPRCCRIWSARRCASARSCRTCCGSPSDRAAPTRRRSSCRAPSTTRSSLWPQRAIRRRHRGDSPVRGGAAGARERDPAGGGVHPADSERAQRDDRPTRRQADPGDQGDREQARARHGVG